MGSRSPGEGAILGERVAHCKVGPIGTFCRELCKKWLNRSICRLGYGLPHGQKEAQVQLYSPDGANVPTWEGILAPPGEHD